MTSIDYSLDIRQDSCPMTFVKTALLLEKMQPGQKLAVQLSAGEALENLPVAVLEKSGKVLSIETSPEGHHIIIIEKQ